MMIHDKHWILEIKDLSKDFWAAVYIYSSVSSEDV